METKKFKLGDIVRFKDEFGREQIGEIASLEPAGKAENGYAINTPKGYGSYIREEKDLTLAASKP